VLLSTKLESIDGSSRPDNSGVRRLTEFGVLNVPRKKEGEMQNENLLSRLDYIIKEIARLDRENPTGPDEETDPRIVKLLKEGMEIQKELDPLMRETFRNRQATLAEWDSIMHMCDEPETKDAGESG
jgi:hypothetical protein